MEGLLLCFIHKLYEKYQLGPHSTSVLVESSLQFLQSCVLSHKSLLYNPTSRRTHNPNDRSLKDADGTALFSNEIIEVIHPSPAGSRFGGVCEAQIIGFQLGGLDAKVFLESTDHRNASPKKGSCLARKVRLLYCRA